jgi:hypothetical membrane protein
VIRLPRRHPPLATVAGLAAVTAGVALGVVAYVLYPWTFSPAENWLSDLGNAVLSPRGAIFFRLDMWVVGVALFAFFLGLRAWSRSRGLLVKLLVALAQASGVVAAIALVMTGVFPENELVAHSLWATIMFVALAVTVWFIAWALLAHPHLSRRIAAFAFAVCAVDVVSAAVRQHWLEWLAVALLLTLVAALSRMTHSLAARSAEGEA